MISEKGGDRWFLRGQSPFHHSSMHFEVGGSIEQFELIDLKERFLWIGTRDLGQRNRPPRTTQPLPPPFSTFVSLSPFLISAAAASAVSDQFQTDYDHRCRERERGPAAVRPPIPR